MPRYLLASNIAFAIVCPRVIFAQTSRGHRDMESALDSGFCLHE